MPKSPRTSHLHSSKHGKRATVQAIAPDTRPHLPSRPWAIGGINFGPAIAAVHDLAAWAFGLAARDVADWPEGKRRVRSARKVVLGRLRGKRRPGFPSEDILFTAGLLARIFEADLRLPMSEMVAIFGGLGLPAELVPLTARPASAACRPQQPPITPISPLDPRPAGGVVRPAPAVVCNGCGQAVPHFRIAA